MSPDRRFNVSSTKISNFRTPSTPLHITQAFPVLSTTTTTTETSADLSLLPRASASADLSYRAVHRTKVLLPRVVHHLRILCSATVSCSICCSQAEVDMVQILQFIQSSPPLKDLLPSRYTSKSDPCTNTPSDRTNHGLSLTPKTISIIKGPANDRNVNISIDNRSVFEYRRSPLT